MMPTEIQKLTHEIIDDLYRYLKENGPRCDWPRCPSKSKHYVLMDGGRNGEPILVYFCQRHLDMAKKEWNLSDRQGK